MMRPVPLPVRGASDKPPYTEQTRYTVPPSCLVNIVPFNAAGTMQLGTAPGLVKRFSARIGTGPVQGGIAVEKIRRITGYVASGCTLVETGTSDDGVTTGNAWLIDGVPSVFRGVFVDVTGINGPAGNSVPVTAVHPDGLVYAVGTNYVNTLSGNLVGTIDVYNVSDNSLVWRHTIGETGVDRFINAMAWTDDYLCVCTNRYLDVYKAAAGAACRRAGISAPFGGRGSSSALPRGRKAGRPTAIASSQPKSA